MGRFAGAAGSGDVAHELAVRVYYEDTDFSGVVYYARYLQFLERGRTEFLRCAGVHHHALWDGPDPMAFAIRSLKIEYRAAARIDDSLRVRTRFFDVRGARLIIGQTIVRGADIVVDADVEGVCLTPAGRARRAPAALIAAINPWLSEKPG